MLRLYTGEPRTTATSEAPAALPDPKAIAENDFKAVSAICSEHNVRTGPNLVQFNLRAGESIVDLVKISADSVWRCLSEVGLSDERLKSLQMSDPSGDGVVLNFEQRSSVARAREVSVVMVDPIARGSKRQVIELRREGYRLGSDLEATVAHLMYRLETSLDGLRGAVKDADLSERSGLPVEPRWTQGSLFGVARTSDGLLRYSSMEGIVEGNFGKFSGRFKESAPIAMVKVA